MTLFGTEINFRAIIENSSGDQSPHAETPFERPVARIPTRLW